MVAGETGETARIDPRAISFRPLLTSDLALMHRWLNASHVARWWYDDAGPYEEVSAKYLAYIEGREPVEPFVILHEDTPIGYIQGYRVSHDEEYAALVDVGDSAGVDLFIGEPEYLHRGLGRPILRKFLTQHVFADPGVEVCVIGPEPKNLAAVRAYKKVGFRYFKTIHVPGEPQPEHLMKLTREEFAEGHVD